MKKSCFVYCSLLAVVMLLTLCGCGGNKSASQSTSQTTAIPEIVAEDNNTSTQPEATEEPEITTISVEADTEEVTFSGYKTPCIAEPYDYEYHSDEKQILIRRYQQDGITFFVVDVQLTDPSQFKTALSQDQPNGKLETVSAMAQRNGAILAINADDYGVHQKGVIVRNGELLRANVTSRHMLIVHQNGNFAVRSNRSNENSDMIGQSLLSINARQTFEFGPELVRNGEAVDFSSDFNLISLDPKRREPRTGIGQIEPLHYVIIVADGRKEGYSKGMTLKELQEYFILFGAKTAMNLDGGGSTELWFNGQIINKLAEGKERKLSDILYF